MNPDYEQKITICNGRQVAVPIPPRAIYSSTLLSKDGIRLLHVKPSDDHHQPIQCHLSSHNLEDAPFYAALSYEWGDPSQWTEIIVNGLSYPVTVNLWRALQQLRQKRFLSLWIDAICIQQDNDQEKEVHVSRMKEIYQSADLVIVWLGLEAHGSDKVMHMLRRIDLSRRQPGFDSMKPWTPTESQVEQIELGLEAFFRRSYWRRAWIRQEIGVASALTILCGSQIAGWKGLEVLLLEILDAFQLPSRYQKNVTSLLNERLDRIGGRTKGLLEVICDSKTAVASDFRDKVFAFLGLAFDSLDFVAQPKYRWSKREICLHMTRRAILAKKNLDIILLRNQPPTQVEENSLPSWCPDYMQLGQDIVQRNMAKYVAGQDVRHRLGLQSRRWKTTVDSYPKREMFNYLDRGYLCVRGLLLGTINGLGCALGRKDEIRQAPDSLRENQISRKVLFTRLSRALTFYAVNQSEDAGLGAALHLLFTYDKPYETFGRPAISRLKRFRSLSKWRRLNQFFMVRGRTLWSRGDGWRGTMHAFGTSESLKSTFQEGFRIFLVKYGDGDLPRDTKLTTPAAKMENILSGMNELVEEGLKIMTTNNDWVGWAHPSAQLYDHVFLLAGCSLPVVLRPSNAGTTFTVVGHAYVGGVMNNEVWSKAVPQMLRDIWLV